MAKKWVGKKFYKLTVTKDFGTSKVGDDTRRFCELSCDCGSPVIIRNVYSVKAGHVMSCGCLPRGSKEVHGDNHGNSYYYRTWCSIKRRCYNKNYFQDSWRVRGIIMCPEWKNNYLAFRTWILDNLGERPHDKMTLDRIDNDGNYEPGNLKWSTRKEQSLNRTPRKYSKITRIQATEIREKYSNGERVIDLAKEYGLYHKYIYSILNFKVWK